MNYEAFDGRLPELPGDRDPLSTEPEQHDRDELTALLGPLPPAVLRTRLGILLLQLGACQRELEEVYARQGWEPPQDTFVELLAEVDRRMSEIE